MPEFTITAKIEARNEHERENVQAALDHLLSLNGARGLLNLFAELKSNPLIKLAVEKIAKRSK